MADFQVAPSALKSFASQLSGAGAGTGGKGLDTEFLLTAQDYSNQWVKLKGGAGGMIFSAIVGAMDSLNDQICANYTSISGLLSSSANNLTGSAASYSTQDHATADRLDSIYKPAGVTALSDEVDTSSPAVDPASVLTEPADDGAVPDMAQQILDAIGFFSETEIVLKILALFGLNVEDWVKERFVGDYKTIAQCRNALINLGKFDDAAATTIADGAATMSKSWKGSAATAAQSYFDQLANGLGNHSNQLSALAQKLDALVVGIQQGGSAIIGILTAVLDKVLEVGAALAAAGCLQEIPGVDIIMDIVGAWKVTELVNKIHELATVWSYVWIGLQTMLGAITSMVGMFQNYSAAAQLPSTGYVNAAEGQQPDSDKATTGKPGAQ
jgi:uncharacterized protein YukE